MSGVSGLRSSAVNMSYYHQTTIIDVRVQSQVPLGVAMKKSLKVTGPGTQNLDRRLKKEIKTVPPSPVSLEVPLRQEGGPILQLPDWQPARETKNIAENVLGQQKEL